MATWDDVRLAVAELPDVTEQPMWGHTSWKVAGKAFLWERPLRPAEIEALGDAMRSAPVLAAQVPDVGVRAAMIADDPAVFFTTPHFEDYPAVLVWLDRIEPATLAELAVEGWLTRAPKRLAKAYLAG